MIGKCEFESHREHQLKTQSLFVAKQTNKMKVRAYLMMTQNPCYVNDVDCPDRKCGCAITCEKWKQYSEVHRKECEERRKIYYQSTSACLALKRAFKKRRL